VVSLTHVHLRKPSLVASFLRIITADAEKSRWLRRNVLSLVLRLPYSIPQNVIFTILTNLSNLRELDISGCACSFSDEELSQLGNSGLCIRLLRLNTSYVGAVGVMVADWPAILKLVAAVPTVLLLDITVHGSLELPKVGWGFYRSNSSRNRWVRCWIFLLAAGPTTSTEQPADLHVFSTYGRHSRWLVVAKELLTHTHLLSHCPHLDFFGCYTLPSNELLAVIPRTIKSLVVANLYFDPTAQPLLMALEHLTQQLGTFPHLRLLDWYGLTETPSTYGEPANCKNTAPAKGSNCALELLKSCVVELLFISHVQTRL
jgi:hypothetical protein